MLQTIREYTQGWIAGTIISIIILTFALWGIHSYFVGGAGNNNVAEVNGIPIGKDQLAVAYERLRRQTQIQYGANSPNTPKDETVLKKRALQALIDVEVLKQASYRQGFRVSDRQIDNYLQSMPEFQVDGQFSLQRFQEVLASTLLSISEFLELIKTSLLIDQPRLGIIFTSYALPEEVTYTIALVNQERDIQYIAIPLQYFLAQPMNVSPEQIQAYYTQHQSDFMTPEQVNVEYLQLSLKDLSAKIMPTETMLKNFYNENINAYTLPMQWKFAVLEIPVAANATQEEMAQAKKNIEAAAVRAVDGSGDADLAKIAKSYAANVTMEKLMPLSQVPAEWQKAVAQLTKAGQVSEPFKTSKNYVIIKALEIQEPKMQAFDTVKDKVQETYVHQHAEEKFAELRDQLADLTYEHPESLQAAAKTLGLPIQTSELFTKEKAGKDISQYKKVRDTAFSNDVLNVQNNSDVIQLNPETVIVLRVKSHTPSTLLPLNGISKQIEDKLKTTEAEAQAAKFAEEFKAKLQAGAEAEQLANTYHFVWKQTGLIGRYSNKVDSAILELAFRLPNPADTQKKLTYGVTRLPSGYAIVALKAVQQGTIADGKQYAVFAEQVQNSEGVLEYELYKQSQTAKAKVEVLN
jgi:peptidyl-prolyl cis-trans isomerase D